MFKLRLSAKGCISCGICMDVCSTKAIDMRIHKGKTFEGSNLSYLDFSGTASKELVREQMMTFPYLAKAELCNGCMICVYECPTLAIDILYDILRIKKVSNDSNIL